MQELLTYIYVICKILNGQTLKYLLNLHTHLCLWCCVNQVLQWLSIFQLCVLQALNTCRSFSFNITWFWTILKIFQRFVLTWVEWKLIWFMAEMCFGRMHSSLKVETTQKNSCAMLKVSGFLQYFIQWIIRLPQYSVLSTSDSSASNNDFYRHLIKCLIISVQTDQLVWSIDKFK